jgi:hypothetical protein
VVLCCTTSLQGSVNLDQDQHIGFLCADVLDPEFQNSCWHNMWHCHRLFNRFNLCHNMATQVSIQPFLQPPNDNSHPYPFAMEPINQVVFIVLLRKAGIKSSWKMYSNWRYVVQYECDGYCCGLSDYYIADLSN